MSNAAALTFKHCLTCGTLFHKRKRDANDRWLLRKWCSRKCARAQNMKQIPLKERLRLNSSPNKSGCLIWTGTIGAGGYGSIKIGKNIKAHRASWIAHKGEIPKGMMVLHKCDTPACINPDHLFIGTQLDNMRDALAKGRNADTRGTKNGRAKLTEAQIADIRQSEETAVATAAKYGVSSSLISQIRLGQCWRHL